MRLIDAEKLTDVAQEAYDRWNLAMAGAENQREINKVFKMQELFKAVMYVDDKCPTVEERKTGHWEYVSTVGGWYVRCSECKHDFNPMTGVRHYKYCAECGASMEDEDG